MNKTSSKDASKKAEPITFHTTILQTGKNTAGIQVPDEVIEKLVQVNNLLFASKLINTRIVVQWPSWAVNT